MSYIGVGSAYGRAEEPIREFIETHKLPYLPTPMGKGVLPDDHPMCVAAARSKLVFHEMFSKILHLPFPKHLGKVCLDY